MEFNSIQDFKSNFAHVYHKSVVPMLGAFEKDKNTTKWIVFVLNLLVAAAAIGIFCCLYFDNAFGDMGGLIIILTVFLIITFGLCAGIYHFFAKNFERKLKTAVMPDLMKAFGNFIWTREGIIDRYTLKETRLFDRFERKRDDDNFYGTYKDLAVNIDEAKLTYTTRDSKGRETTHTEFQGVIIEVDVKKSFRGHIIVRKRALINSTTYGEVKLEDPQFSKQFFIDAHDQVEARYLFTTSFMERFKNIKKAFRADSIEASFKDSKMILALSTTKDLFTIGRLNRPINDTKQFTELLNEFISILAIVDELKLNQNIGL